MKKSSAAALRYDPEDPAPRVVARGKGMAAEALLQIAKESNVPILEVPGLAEGLTRLDPFSFVPEEYWVVVAEILKFVYETRSDDELHQD